MADSKDIRTRWGDIVGRAKSLREKNNLSIQELGRLIGIEGRNIGNYERLSSPPPLDYIVKICEYFSVSYDWLIDGVDSGPGLVKICEKKNSGFPVLGSACAGQNGFLVNGSADYYIEWPAGTRDPKAFGLEVRGDSMFPVYKDGDVVICSRAARLHPDCDAVVAIGDDCYCKIWRPLPGDRVELACYNKSTYDPMVVNRSEIKDTAKIIGLLWRVQAADMRVDGPSIQPPAKLQLKK